MESNFNNREFEQYVKRNADQYRMIPSEKVWKGINTSLHTRRRWYGFGLAFLLLLTAVSVTWVMVTYPVSKKQETAISEKANPSLQTIPANKKQVNITPAVSNEINNLLSYNKFSTQFDAAVTDKQLNDPENTGNGTNNVFLPDEDKKVSESVISPHALHTEIWSSVVSSDKKETTDPVSLNAINSTSKPADIVVTDNKVLAADKQPLMLLSQSKTTKNNSVVYPLNTESGINAYQPKKTSKKLTWQLYFAPTVSYRKLSVNKSFNANVSPFSVTNYPFASLKDVNGEVTHKPDMGLELGVSTRYSLSKNLKLRGGFQFNINRYDIKAFAYYGEEATINLNGGNGTNSVRAWTYYRNYSGYKSDWLKNYYFSVSAPVGAELRLLGNSKTYFGIAGTVQPTYILKDRAFLISTDYKNYVEMPSFIRHFNVNTSFETFISYTSRSAKTRWQIGPQVRYQVLSSFKNQYPIKENLFDFGLKVGISRNK